MTVGRLDRKARMLYRANKALAALHVLPTPERFVLRPLAKRRIVPLPKWVLGPIPTDVTIRDATCPSADGDIALRIYEPVGADEVLPGLVYLHGGGWVMGCPETTDNICAQLASRARIRIVSVDYRLSPDTAYPGPLDDAVTGLEWTVANAEALKVDPDRIAVGGDSAGGNLAAALTLRARDLGVPLVLQLLIYPVLDGTFSTESQANHTGAGIVQADMEVYYRCYSGGADRANPLLSPLLVESTVGLPPAVVVTAGFDCLRDEGRLYVDRLREGGVEAQLHHFPDAAHGFLSVPGLSAQAVPALEAIGPALRSGLHGARA